MAIVIASIVLALVLLGVAIYLAVRGMKEEKARRARRDFCIIEEPQR